MRCGEPIKGALLKGLESPVTTSKRVRRSLVYFNVATSSLLIILSTDNSRRLETACSNGMEHSLPERHQVSKWRCGAKVSIPDSHVDDRGREVAAGKLNKFINEKFARFV